MKPITFKEVNIVFAEDQPEYQPLPVMHKRDSNSEVVACWKLSVWERIKLLFTGRLWVSIWTFNNPLSPSYVTVNKSEVIKPIDEPKA